MHRLIVIRTATRKSDAVTNATKIRMSQRTPPTVAFSHHYPQTHLLRPACPASRLLHRTLDLYFQSRCVWMEIMIIPLGIVGIVGIEQEFHDI
jgi:hypothetical protein